MNEANLSSENSPQKMIGQIINQRWEIIEYLGEGSMSYVFKACEKETGKQIALKLIKEHLIKNIDNKKAFTEEARKFLALNHENIASYYDFIFDNNNLFLFCDYLPGESLAATLSKHYSFSLEECTSLFKQISEGLDYAHENKIQHGDLRTSNIFIVEDYYDAGRPKIVDFGLMRLLEKFSNRHKMHQTSTHPALGNALYISPEQRTNKKINNRADLYSLGCILYETITGRPPFSSSNAMETTYKQIWQKPTPLDEILPAQPLLKRYQKILEKLLAVEQSKRYPSVSLLRHDLELLSADENEWQAKAYALQKIKPLRSFLHKWRIPLAVAAFSFVFICTSSLVVYLTPYYQPWKGTADFDDNRLWISQDKHIQKPKQELIKQKNILLRKLFTIAQKEGEESSNYLNNLFTIVRINLALGEWYEAKETLIKIQEHNETNTISSANILSNLAFIQLMIGDLVEAKKLSMQALSTCNSNTNIDAQLVALKVLADIDNQQNNFTGAKSTYERLYNIADKYRLNKPAEFACASAQLADIYRRENKLDNAEKLYHQGIDWGENYIGHNQPFMAKSLYGLALVEYQKNNTDESVKLLLQALPIAFSLYGPNDNFVLAIEKFYDYLLFQQDKIHWFKAKLDS